MTQPEALRLADELERWTLGEPAAEELRRLHELNQELVEALRKAIETTYSDSLFAEWSALIAKATGENK